MHILFHYDLYDDLKKTLFIKIHERNTLFTNYNNHDKFCFFFQQYWFTYQQATANFVFQAFAIERRKKRNK